MTQEKVTPDYIPSLQSSILNPPENYNRPNISPNIYGSAADDTARPYDDFGALMQTLHNEGSKSTFLKRVWRPGRTEVASEILARSGHYDSEYIFRLVKSEIDLVNQGEENPAAIELGRRYLDLIFAEGKEFESLEATANAALKLKNTGLIKYALQKIKEKSSEGEHDDMYGLSCNAIIIAELAIASGDISEKNSALYERLNAYLNYYENHRDSSGALWYSAPKIAEILESLERYRESLDWRLKTGDPRYIAEAFRLAKLHAPEKMKDIAGVGYNMYRVGGRIEDGCVGESDFLGYAKVLGRTGEAEEKILSKSLPLEEHPGDWNKELVNSYVKGHKDEAIEALWKSVKCGRVYSLSSVKKLANVIDDEERVKPILNYRAMLDAEETGNYGEAARLARIAWESDLIPAYDRMSELTGKSKPRSQKTKTKRLKALKKRGV
jgi:tetratricopeptide (TPR) repeat protein